MERSDVKDAVPVQHGVLVTHEPIVNHLVCQTEGVLRNVVRAKLGLGNRVLRPSG